MARIRTIKPEFWEDEKVGKLSKSARLVLIYLWYSSNDKSISDYTLESCKKGANLHRYGTKTHNKIISELVNKGHVDITNHTQLKVKGRDILGVKRATNRFDIQDYSEWKKIREFVFNRDNYTCAYCGKRGGKLEVDHIIPTSKGGSDDLSNLTTSCMRCNRQKKDKAKEEFIIWKQGKS